MSLQAVALQTFFLNHTLASCKPKENIEFTGIGSLNIKVHFVIPNQLSLWHSSEDIQTTSVFFQIFSWLWSCICELCRIYCIIVICITMLYMYSLGYYDGISECQQQVYTNSAIFCLPNKSATFSAQILCTSWLLLV